jgi:hypothetical protein
VDDGLAFVLEMNEAVWSRFNADIGELTREEAEWRPLPEANNISLILRHLRIEAAWHLASLEQGDPMPREIPPELQQRIDSVPDDYEQNAQELARLQGRFLSVLRACSLAELRTQTRAAYGSFEGVGAIPPHFLGFHQATHLAAHGGQIRTLRNLYRKTCGQPARFHPQNPTYPAA